MWEILEEMFCDKGDETIMTGREFETDMFESANNFVNIIHFLIVTNLFFEVFEDEGGGFESDSWGDDLDEFLFDF